MAQSPPPSRSYTPVQHPQISQPRPTSIALPGEPPAKRPRLSPTPSPFSGGPYAPSPVAASPLVPYSALPDHSSLQAFNTPQPVQPYHPDVGSRNAAGTMGPPERPRKDKDMDVSDLQDVVNASGIDLREEENYMASTYRYRGDSSTQSTSFGSYTTSPNNSFGVWQQGSFGSYPAFQGTGPYSQPAVPQKTVEELVEEKHRLAARKLAERQEKHLRRPFLNAEFLRNKLHDVTYKLNVRLTVDGRPAQSDRPKVFGSYVGGADGVGIVQARAQSAINDSSKIADLLSLISLATEERLRGILEDAVSIARSRRSTSEGVVPVDFVDIADGPSKPTKTTIVIPTKPITSGIWEGVHVPDSAVSPFTVVPRSLKTGDTSFSTTLVSIDSQDVETSEADAASLTNGETGGKLAGKPEVKGTDLPPTPPTSEPKDSISFPSPMPTLLRALGNADLSAEKARLEARKRRKAEREARDKERQNSVTGQPSGGDANASPSSAADPSSAATPSTPVDKDLKAEVAPVKLSKKEREKAAKANQTSEAAMRRDANATANMALGGLGKKYSWMTAASAAPAAPAFGAGAGMGPSRGGGGVTAPGAAKAGSGAAGAAPGSKESEEERSLKAGGAHRRVGLWKESGPGGDGVQVRDVVAVLERDATFGDAGCEKVLARALVRGVRDEDVDAPVKDAAKDVSVSASASAAAAAAAAGPLATPAANGQALPNGAVATPGVNGTG